MAVRQIPHHFVTKANAKIVAVLAEIIGEKVGRFYRNPGVGQWLAQFVNQKNTRIRGRNTGSGLTFDIAVPVDCEM